MYPCDESSLRGALETAEEGIIVPILVGPAARSTASILTKRHRGCRPRRGGGWQSSAVGKSRNGDCQLDEFHGV